MVSLWPLQEAIDDFSLEQLATVSRNRAGP
jgi:hypothetical protein